MQIKNPNIEIRKNLNLKSIGNSIAIMLSLASAHYMGFLTHIPFEMLTLVADNFLKSFISTFTFYALLSLTISRVIAFSFSQLVSSEFSTLAAISLRLRRHWPNRFDRLGINIYKETEKVETASYWLILSFVFLFTLNFSYTKISTDKIGNFSWLMLAAMIVAIFLRAGFLNRNPKEATLRILNKKRVRLRVQIIKLLVRTGTGLLLAFSFYTGIFRYEKLLNEHPLTFQSKNYKGEANIILNSGNKFLLIEKSENKKYIYTDEENIITYEEKLN